MNIIIILFALEGTQIATTINYNERKTVRNKRSKWDNYTAGAKSTIFSKI